jgi:hypothetical protein
MTSQQVRSWKPSGLGPTDYLFSDGETDVMVMELLDGSLRITTEPHGAMYPRWSPPWTPKRLRDGWLRYKPNHPSNATVRICKGGENGYVVHLRYGKGSWRECQVVWF